MDRKVVLEMKDVTVELGGKVVLENVSLKVYEHETLVIIEIQRGDYTGEDDIVRLEDDYGRQDA